MEAWLSAHALRPGPRVTPTVQTDPDENQMAISQDQLVGRRGRAADGLRKQRRDIAESLGARDLEKVVAFAEFIKARRSARTYNSRQEASVEEAEPGDDSDDEEPTPSSRRQAANN
jgi:hypothetical protein